MFVAIYTFFPVSSKQITPLVAGRAIYPPFQLQKKILSTCIDYFLTITDSLAVSWITCLSSQQSSVVSTKFVKKIFCEGINIQQYLLLLLFLGMNVKDHLKQKIKHN